MSSAVKKIGLALSGGGFRASLYHLGLVRFLRDAGVLSSVTHITSVSGGSILAAHLVLNWDRYTGSPDEFDAAAAELLAGPDRPDAFFVANNLMTVGVLAALREASAILLAPSNPLVSLGTILAIPGVREALRVTRARRVAISPIVAGGTIKGPADRMMRGLGWEVSAVGVARAYRDILDVMVIDRADEALAGHISELGLEAVVADTIMRDAAAKAALARVVLEAVG
jgi:hypothetical protein